MREFHVIRIAGRSPTPFELVTKGEEFAQSRCDELNRRTQELSCQNRDSKGARIFYEVVSDRGCAKRLRALMGIPLPDFSVPAS